jgi:nucleotide-binding universal stress UspA family protein
VAVPPGTEFKLVKKLGLACDFKDVVSSTPINYIKQFAQEFRAELHVLNVDQNNHYFMPDANLESGYLDTLLQDFHPRYHFLHKEDIVDAITEFSETNNLDLVIVIPKKHKLLEGIFHKSSSAGLVNRSHVPVVAIHE